MSLWDERFKHSTPTEMNPTFQDVNRAWDWVFEKDSSGQFERAGLCILIIREKSLALRKSGIKNQTSEISVVDIWKKYSVKIKIPVRGNQRLEPS